MQRKILNVLMIGAGLLAATVCLAADKDLSGQRISLVPVQIDKKVEVLSLQDKAVALVPGATAKDMAEADAYVKQQAGPTDDPTSGTTYYVAMTGLDANPGTQALPFRHIQHAVDVAQNGDTVQIMPGIYPEHLVFNKYLQIVGSPHDPSLTIIDGTNNGGVLTVSITETVNQNMSLSIRGLTIQNGSRGVSDWNGWGGGLFIQVQGGVLLEDLMIKDNVAYNAGGGIYIQKQDQQHCAVIRKCVVSGNRARAGHGIFWSGHGYFGDLTGVTDLMENVVVASNGVNANGCSVLTDGAGILLKQAKVDLVNLSIVNNTNLAGIYGAGLKLFSSHVCVLNTIIWDNTLVNANTGALPVPSQVYVGADIPNYGPALPGYVNVQYSDVQNGGHPHNSFGAGFYVNGTQNFVAYPLWGFPDPVNNLNSYAQPGGSTANPLFSSVASGHYPLRAASPCLRGGKMQAVFEQHIYSNGQYVQVLNPRTIAAPVVDISGNQRPGFNAQGVLDIRPDMGAYEIGRIGDINHSGYVNAVDALLAAKHFTQMVTLNPSQQVEADANDSGNVNAIDALLIQKFFAQMITVLPYTGP